MVNKCGAKQLHGALHKALVWDVQWQHHANKQQVGNQPTKLYQRAEIQLQIQTDIPICVHLLTQCHTALLSGDSTHQAKAQSHQPQAIQMSLKVASHADQ
jgi:hypothetical protein